MRDLGLPFLISTMSSRRMHILLGCSTTKEPAEGTKLSSRSEYAWLDQRNRPSSTLTVNHSRCGPVNLYTFVPRFFSSASPALKLARTKSPQRRRTQSNSRPEITSGRVPRSPCYPGTVYRSHFPSACYSGRQTLLSDRTKSRPPSLDAKLCAGRFLKRIG